VNITEINKNMKPKPTQDIINKRFEEIKELVNLGYPRYIACKKLKISRSIIYKYFNNEQLRELDELYFSNSNGSYATKSKVEKK
jgi:hypothetical protein